MELTDLNTFVKGAKANPFRCNAWIAEPGFSGIYVRYTKRSINGRMRRVLDLASIQADQPGSGAFTRLLDKLKSNYPKLTLYIECVLPDRFAEALVNRFGFTRDPRYPNDRNYYLLPERKG